ncbi:hypothetical protein ACVMJX_15880 [Escherichia coli]|uniref:hypothetical protein n=2 Tax=Escherichia coli TaxID=562 RepID=UPI000A187D2E|nr:hypothetical protein [Escherichia coli]EFN3866741.1 hypothetical protein [Escherichia coli]EHA4474116.1 hypothetical protein [Escherichia coli]EHA4558457.1 hypothetical protein [Escherichia coli]EJF3768389.1 hypothetical protein [Escherichia coli]ELD0521500.1 hypothetical protein [Escherichia coli]
MDFLIAMGCSFLFFMLVAAIFQRLGISLKGTYVHPISLSVLIQFCLFSLPGVVMISFLDYQSPRYEGITLSNRLNIGLWYFYSVLVYFSVFILLASVFRLKNYNRYVSRVVNYDNYIVYSTIILSLSVIFLCIKLFFSRKAPIFYLLEGDSVGAYTSRVDIQTNPQYYYIPYISNLISLLLVFQFYFIFYFYTFTTKKTYKLIFFVITSFLIAVIECLYETQKAPVIFLMLGTLFIIYLKKKRIMKTMFLIGSIVFLAILLQATLSGTELNVAINSMADRFLLGQNQGFYHIINKITPNEKYWFTNFYFVERLGITPARADVDIIPYLNYVSSLDIVNVNSYYLGEAWSMFGYYGLILSPILVGGAMFIFVKIIDLLIGYNPYFFIPYAILIIPELRINQSFTYFLYGKDFVFRTILVLIIFFLVTALGSLFIKKKKIGIIYENRKQ